MAPAAGTSSSFVSSAIERERRVGNNAPLFLSTHLVWGLVTLSYHPPKLRVFV